MTAPRTDLMRSSKSILGSAASVTIPKSRWRCRLHGRRDHSVFHPERFSASWFESKYSSAEFCVGGSFRSHRVSGTPRRGSERRFLERDGLNLWQIKTAGFSHINDGRPDFVTPVPDMRSRVRTMRPNRRVTLPMEKNTPPIRKPSLAEGSAGRFYFVDRDPSEACAK